MKKLLLLLFLLIGTSNAVTISGTIKGLDGSGLNGTLFISPQSTASISGNCTSALAVASASIVFVNGIAQSNPDIAPSTCLNPKQPYLVQFYSGSKFVFSTTWWMSNLSGAYLSGANKFIYASGVFQYSTPSVIQMYQMTVNDNKFASGSVSLARSDTSSFTLSWSKNFSDTNYVAACEPDNQQIIITGLALNKNSVVVTAHNSNNISTVSFKLYCNAHTN